MPTQSLFKHFPLTHILGVGALFALLAILFFWPASSTDKSTEPTAQVATSMSDPSLEDSADDLLPDINLHVLTSTDEEEPVLEDIEPVQEPTWQYGKVQSGDSLSVIFKRYDLGASNVHNIAQIAPKEALKIQPNQQLRWQLNDEDKLQQFIIDISPLAYHSFRRNDDGSFKYQKITNEAERQLRFAQATITSSLFVDGYRAGVPEKALYDIANIFGWDIDFASDIREGDSFSVVFEELYLDGERIGYGNTLATKFFNRGRELTAVRYTNAQGISNYFTPDGRSMRKEFLRNPIDFTRISSRFSTARKHPVLQSTIRAHKGTDYAAPTGTPIKASGDGKIIFAGRKGGYGNAVILQHGQTYTTLYGHLSRFHKDTKTGRFVKQGQVIGYVGMTGLASGPHLHYEFQVNGVHRDPLTVKLPQAQSIGKNEMAAFNKATQGTVQWLETQLTASTQEQAASN